MFFKPHTFSLKCRLSVQYVIAVPETTLSFTSPYIINAKLFTQCTLHKSNFLVYKVPWRLSAESIGLRTDQPRDTRCTNVSSGGEFLGIRIVKLLKKMDVSQRTFHISSKIICGAISQCEYLIPCCLEYSEDY